MAAQNLPSSTPSSPPINILLLGPPSVGKITFLRRIASGPSNPTPSSLTLPVTLKLRQPRPDGTLLNLTVLDFDEDLEETWLTTALTVVEEAQIILLCYSTASLCSLETVWRTWQKLKGAGLDTDAGGRGKGVDVMLLGLKRDLRRPISSEDEGGGDGGVSAGVGNGRKSGSLDDERMRVSSWSGTQKRDEAGYNAASIMSAPPPYSLDPPQTLLLEEKHDVQFREMEVGRDASEDISVMPRQGLEVAQKLRLDRYAECSAVTGELMREVWEDIVGMCMKVNGGNAGGGGEGEGGGCCVM